MAQRAGGSELLSEIVEQRASLADSDPAIVGGLLRVLHTLLVQSGPQSLSSLDPVMIGAAFAEIPDQTPNRHLLLQLLAMIRSDQSLAMLVESLKTSPPGEWMEGAQVLSPLMQHNDWPVDAFYPAVLTCLQYPSLAAPLLDLANYVTRSGQVTVHTRHRSIDHAQSITR